MGPIYGGRFAPLVHKMPGVRLRASYWEMGGIRWKAKGEQRNYLKCINCGKRSWHHSYIKNAEEPVI